MTTTTLPDTLPALPDDLFASLPGVSDTIKGARMKDIASGRSEAFKVCPLKIRPVEGFNGRRKYEGIPELAADMLENGQSDPITIRRDTAGRLLIVTGERRWRASIYIIRVLGITDWLIKCQLEAPGSKPIDRIFRLLSENSGHPFTLLEKGYLYERALREEPTLNEAALARRSQTSRQAVNQALLIVRNGAPELLCMAEQDKLSATLAKEIILRHKHNHQLQVRDAEAALDAAKEQGKDAATPKHLPPVALRFEFTEGDATVNEHHVYTNPSRFTLREIPGSWTLTELDLMLVHEDGRWHDNYELTAGNYSLDGLPNRTAFLDPDPESEPEAWMTVYFSAIKKLLGSSKLTEKQQDLLDEAWCRALRERFPNHTPSTRHQHEDEEEQQHEEEPAATDEPGLFPDPDEDEEPTALEFDLFRLTGRPDPGDARTFPDGSEPEQYRFVLLNVPEDWGIQSLHILATFSLEEETDGYRRVNFGHRVTTSDGEEHTRLPERSAWRWSELDMERHAQALSILVNDYNLPGEAEKQITEAWDAAIAKFFGLNPEPSTDMEWIDPAKQPSPPDPGAIDRIKGAKDTNRDGSPTGPGGGGFVKPDKRLEQYEKLLESVSADNHDNDRMKTAELISSYMNNTADGTALRKHLRGQ